VVTAALHALPCEFADISPATRIRTSQATGEGSIIGWEETRAHPRQGMKEDMGAVGGRVDLGAVLLFLFMRNDEWGRCQFASVDIGLADLVRVSL
jgi:hypothetical protein